MHALLPKGSTFLVAILFAMLSAPGFAAPPSHANNKDKSDPGDVSDPVEDPVAPASQLRITSHGSGFVTKTGSITVNLLFEGVNGGATVAWTNTQGGSGSATFLGKNAYEAGPIALAVGTNLLSFTGYDKSGAAHVSTLAVTREDTAPVPDPNQPPEISGTPDTHVTAGSSYSFQPEASDPDGDGVGFSITGKPAWASFDTVSGRLSGTPGEAHVGLHANIEIAVSDGLEVVALPLFNVTVEAPPPVTGSATLSWVPPLEREDGSALTNLAGYEIHFGSAAGALDQVIVLENAGLTSYVIENLGAGTWYFGMKAVDAQGLESKLSTVVSKTIS